VNIEFDEPSHTYKIDGVVVPSVTQCLKLLDPFQKVDRHILEAARLFGHQGHKAMTLLLKDRLNWATLDPVLKPYIEAGAEFLYRQHDFLVIAAEHVVASKTLGVAGTIDLIGEDERWTYIVEWKFTADQPWTAGAQTAAYERLYTRSVRTKRLCVVLKPGKYDTVVLNDPADWNTFLSCLNVTKARMKHGID
jgi:hypothetical protein